MANRSNPEKIVLHFLDLMERRDLVAAQALLGNGFVMEFPGPTLPASLDQLVEWASSRYRFVRKRFEHVDVVEPSNGRSVVYCSGSLHGEWIDGTAFEGIRFIDRFELQDDLILRQSVWNDMALHLPATT